MIATDVEGRIIYANAEAYRLYRHEPGTMVGRNINALTVPLLTREQAAAIMSQLVDGKPWSGEFLVQDSSGRKFPAFVTDTPILDNAGKLIGVVGISRDVSADRELREALQASEQRYRDLFEQYRLLFVHNPHPMWTYDVETLRFLAVNHAALDHYGYSEADFLSMTIRDLHPAEDVKWLQRTLDRIAGKRKGFGVWRHLKKDGTPIDVELVSDDVMFNGRRARLVLANDITESHRVEERLIEQATLLDKANDAISVRDLGHRVHYWNPSAERLFGWSAAEIEGQCARDLLANDVDAYDLASMLTKDAGEWAGELEKRTRDGRIVTVNSRWTLLRDELGLPKSFLAIENDITEKKRLETQALRAQRMESLGTLAGGIAHDLNNVLAPIMMSVELLKEEPLNPDAQDLLDTLGTSARRGAELVKQVLSFARGVEGQRVSVDVNVLLRDLVKVMQDTFPKSIRLRPIAAPEARRVRGDSTQLHQVLLNLCVNARDAMPNGGVVTLRLQNVTLDDTYSALSPDARPGHYVLVEVSDTGVGIPPAIRERIFEPFFTTKELGKGTGLGLSTSQAIIKSHGGFISLYSEVAKGTTFRVYLPAMSPSADDVSASDQQPQLPRGNGELILAVDDDENVRAVVTRTLERFGYRVVTAAHGAEAVAIFAGQRGDIAAVLTDMAMPIMDGPALVVAIRSLDPDARIIGSSGLTQGGATQALNAGLNHFVEKPYTADALLNTLAKVLHGDRP